jgi:hypothetical protein
MRFSVTTIYYDCHGQANCLNQRHGQSLGEGMGELVIGWQRWKRIVGYISYGWLLLCCFQVVSTVLINLIPNGKPALNLTGKSNVADKVKYLYFFLLPKPCSIYSFKDCDTIRCVWTIAFNSFGYWVSSFFNRCGLRYQLLMLLMMTMMKYINWPLVRVVVNYEFAVLSKFFLFILTVLFCIVEFSVLWFCESAVWPLIWYLWALFGVWCCFSLLLGSNQLLIMT